MSRSSGIVFALVVFVFCQDVIGADKARIQNSINRAQSYILQNMQTSPAGVLASLAYVKSGGDKKAAPIERILSYVLSKFSHGDYRPREHYNYEAGVDLMFLEAIDPETYKPQMELIVAFLLKTQLPNGAWFYREAHIPDCGDTSITQYAILGLWAGARAGIEIPVENWERAARWHFVKQLEDGGFSYQPLHDQLVHRRSSATMSAAGSSNLLIIRRMLFGDEEISPEVRPKEVKRRFGVLEKFVDEKPVQKQPANPTLQPAIFDKSIKEGVRWTTLRFVDRNGTSEKFFCYYLYSIERVAALLDVERLGNHDWYDEGADEFLKRQAGDGSWTDESTTLASTAFGLMFLSKATATIVTPKKQVNLLGGGIQIGGRGLPENLGAVQVKEGAVSERKITGPVDSLLIELERSADAKVEDVQTAVVEAVQLDRPEELIGQVKKLSKLAVDPRVEVRRTAFWALGRSGDITTAKLLIEGLSDPDIAVTREASLGLCILTRRPEGCGKAIDPTDDYQMGLSEDASDDERKTKLQEWQVESRKRWVDWYQKYRPYDERDDRVTLKKVPR